MKVRGTCPSCGDLNLPWKVRCRKCGANLLAEVDVRQFLTKAADSKNEPEIEPYYYKSRYSTVRTVSAFVEFVGWITFLAGVLISIGTFTSEVIYGFAALLVILPGLGITMAGLVMVMVAQLTAATVDTADYTREILKVLINRNE